MNSTSPALDQMPSITEQASTPDLLARPAATTTRFAVARTLAQVESCWRLVHDCYCERGLIDANDHGLHTSLPAASSRSTIIYGQTDGRVHSTLTVIADGPQGLPLESVYPNLLDALRQRGRQLVEVGLLADCRGQSRRDRSQAYGTMRYGFHQALRRETDIIIGVHPRHVAFYVRMMGMEVIGPMSLHPTVKHRPVVPLRLDMTRVHLKPLPPLLRHFMARPVEAAELAGGFAFHAPAIRSSTLEGYLDHLLSQQKMRQFHPATPFMPMQQTGSL